MDRDTFDCTAGRVVAEDDNVTVLLDVVELSDEFLHEGVWVSIIEQLDQDVIVLRIVEFNVAEERLSADRAHRPTEFEEACGADVVAAGEGGGGDGFQANRALHHVFSSPLEKRGLGAISFLCRWE